jgi:hypothetical protein
MAKNMNKMLKKAQKLQSQMMQAQNDLNEKEFEGTAGGGMVKVTLKGSHEVSSLNLNPEVVDPDDTEMLEDLIIAAFQNAEEQIKKESDSAFGQFSEGMNLPGLT